MLPSFFHRIVMKQNIIFDIFRHVELTNDIVWRIEGVKGLTVRGHYAAEARDEHVTKLDNVPYIIRALFNIKTSKYLSNTNEVCNKAQG